jgi:hypothetical protein
VHVNALNEIIRELQKPMITSETFAAQGSYSVNMIEAQIKKKIKRTSSSAIFRVDS